MSKFKMGINLPTQASAWEELLEAARNVDRRGYEHVRAWDHLEAIFE